MKAHDMFRHQMRWALAAHGLGLAVTIVGLLIGQLPLAMAGALFSISVDLGSRATMRCPFCQRTVSGYIVRWPLLWTSRVPKRCPYCDTDYDRDIWRPENQDHEDGDRSD